MGKRSLGLIGLAVGLSLTVVACGSDSKSNSSPSATSGNGKAATGDPILIGMDLDSTGAGASYSVITAKTLNASLDMINSQGGVLGRPLKFITENDESDPTKTPAVIQKLKSGGAKMLIMQTGGAAIAQAKSTIQQIGIPAIAPTSVTAALGNPPDNTYTYTIANSTDDWAKVYCGAFTKAGYQKIGVLSDDTTTIAGLNKALFAAMPCVKTTIEKAPANASDLTANVARLKDGKYDAILVTSVGGPFEVLAQNTLASQMPDAPRFSLASIGNQPASWKLANPGALKGMIFMASINLQNPATKSLQDFLRAKNGKDYELVAYDGQAYDTMQIIKSAIEKAGGADDPKKLNDAIQSISGLKSSFGQPGFTLSFSPTKHLGADGLCGLSLVQFGADNKPDKPWPTYQPPCK